MTPQRSDVVVIGAGHSGLVFSRQLSVRGIDHVVLERAEIGAAWRSRWDSLRLLTPNWTLRLPAAHPDGADPTADPDGFASSAAVAELLTRYSAAIDAPLLHEADVTAVRADAENPAAGGGYVVDTARGAIRSRAVVIATGAGAHSRIPELARGADPAIRQLGTAEYRNPDSLPAGGVLVVGAAASGVQLAEELARDGRRVVLAVGEHVRLPRRYRGRDIFWWLDRAGVLDERWDEVDDIVRARHTPSPQLIAGAAGRDIGLGTLQRDHGVRVVGRLGRLRGTVAQFSGGLANTVKLADLKQQRLLDRFDAWAATESIPQLPPAERFAETPVDAAPLLELDLAREGIASILWATGYRADYDWLRLPVLDHRGRLRHEGGVVAPGVYTLGTSLLRRRRSSYIGGAADDSHDLAEHLEAHLRGSSRA